MGDRLFRMIPLVIEVSMGQSKALDSGESGPLLRKNIPLFRLVACTYFGTRWCEVVRRGDYQ